MTLNPILVVDSSVIVKWVSAQDELHLKQADELMQACERGKHVLYAPALSSYEVGNALLKGKQLSLHEVRTSLDILYSLPIRFIADSADTALSTARIADSHDVTYYDASFIALAAALGGSLITDNVKHQGKAKECPVIALKDYKA